MNDIRPLLTSLSEGYYIRQVIVITGLFVAGAFFLKLCMKKADIIWQYLLAFPMGLVLWGISGFVLLTVGIPYRLPFIALLLAGICLLFFFFVRREEKICFSLTDGIAVVFVIVFAIFACSGLLRVSITNDSVYYYSVYPQALTKYGEYRKSFDVFLTDVGQTTALIYCLPFFFGFNETFGIQHFMNFNFAGVFFMAVYETAKQYFPAKKAVVSGLAAAAFLFASTPFLITAKWVLANVYFMDFLFILFYLGGKCGRKRDEWEKYKWVLCLFTAMLSMMRMEGGMVACLLILCLSLFSYTNREIICYYLLPVSFMQISYYAMLYLKLKVDPLYSFLDIKKALLMLALLLGLLFYFLFIRNRRFQKLLRYPEIAVLGGLLGGNAVLLVLSTERYLINLSCFAQNIILQNGWGYFGFIVLILMLVLPKKMGRVAYPDFFCFAYILLTIAVCWARGGNLRVGIGDSGNRVMMQIVPFVVYALAVHIIRYAAGEKEN